MTVVDISAQCMKLLFIRFQSILANSLQSYRYQRLNRDALSPRSAVDRVQTLVSISLKVLTHTRAYNYKPKRSSLQHAFHAPNGFLRLLRLLAQVGLVTNNIKSLQLAKKGTTGIPEDMR